MRKINKKMIRKIFMMSLACLTTSIAVSQTKFRMGINYTGGLATIIGNDIQYSFKPSLGVGGEAEYNFSTHSALSLSTGYLQLGSKFSDEVDNGFNPSYKLEYWSVQLFYKYIINPQGEKLVHFAEMGFEENTLLSAASVNTYGSTNIKDNITSYSYGIIAGIGTSCKLKMYGTCQLTLLSGYGLNNIYRGMMSDNGFSGNNLFIGLRASCLLGNNTKE